MRGLSSPSGRRCKHHLLNATLWCVLEDKHVLILGHGSIGRGLEARLKPFGAQVTGVTRSGRDGTVPVAGAATRSHV